MAEYTLLLPEMGEGVMEATVVRWAKHEGDFINEDEEIVEVATDKVDSDIPSPCTGRILKYLAQEGDVVKIGEPLVIIELIEEKTTEKELDFVADVVLEKKTIEKLINNLEVNSVERTTITEDINTETQSIEKSEEEITSLNNDIFLSPLVKSIIFEENITKEEIQLIQGTGLENRITKEDVLFYLTKRNKLVNSIDSIKNEETSADSKELIINEQFINLDIKPSDEVVEIDRMRKLISNHMTLSKNTAVHVTSFVEADMTNVVKWRDLNKEAYKIREEENLTFTPIIVSAVVKALKDFPMLNISFDGKNIIKKKNINIGIATALPNGNLIVPVVKNADQLSILEISKQINQLIFKARHNKLQPRDITEGTYTISNIGSFGNLIGTPIINQPQVAILAVGAIKKKPTVIETSEGDYIGIRQKMFLSHSYDHRIIDGMLGGSFVQRVAYYLENFDLNTLI